MVLILSNFLNIKTMVLYSGGSINRESPVCFIFLEGYMSRKAVSMNVFEVTGLPVNAKNFD